MSMGYSIVKKQNQVNYTLNIYQSQLLLTSTIPCIRIDPLPMISIKRSQSPPTNTDIHNHTKTTNHYNERLSTTSNYKHQHSHSNFSLLNPQLTQSHIRYNQQKDDQSNWSQFPKLRCKRIKIFQKEDIQMMKREKKMTMPDRVRQDSHKDNLHLVLNKIQLEDAVEQYKIIMKKHGNGYALSNYALTLYQVPNIPAFSL